MVPSNGVFRLNFLLFLIETFIPSLNFFGALFALTFLITIRVLVILRGASRPRCFGFSGSGISKDFCSVSVAASSDIMGISDCVGWISFGDDGVSLSLSLSSFLSSSVVSAVTSVDILAGSGPGSAYVTFFRCSVFVGSAGTCDGSSSLASGSFGSGSSGSGCGCSVASDEVGSPPFDSSSGLGRSLSFAVSSGFDCGSGSD
mmetsp:Transcript_61041/g.55046  ORF Transcript_61041/g.55046 Transcript_61041/m.55046 type:complete len:202 (-) Transcript_61041:654-1259(-)